MEHILTSLSHRYPQLLLPISDETRHSELYKNTVLRGEPLSGIPDFTLSGNDRFETALTPAGTVEVLTLSERADFEHCIRALSYRCENRPVPPSMGAATISGLINWEKIRNHQKDFLASGGTDWNKEFSVFTSDRRNFRDTIIVLSSSGYSGLSAWEAGDESSAWLSHSHTIRKYHELAHFTSRELFPENKDAVRDEVLADMNGIIAAYGHYDARIARKFLGVNEGSCRPGGRLLNYVSPEDLPASLKRVSEIINFLEKNYDSPSVPFELLIEFEKNKLFL